MAKPGVSRSIHVFSKKGLNMEWWFWVLLLVLVVLIGVFLFLRNKRPED